MPRLKVLEVLEATVGGAWKHVAQLLRGLDPARFELHLACSTARSPSVRGELDDLQQRGVRVWPVRMLRRPALFTDLAALQALTNLMREGRYDIVHTHASKAGFLGRLAARRAGVPAIVHTPHTFPFERRDTPLAPLYRALERRAAEWAQRLILVSPSQRQVAEGAGIGSPGQLVVVPNGIRVPEVEPAEARRKFRNVLGLSETEVAVGFVGRVTPQKDVQTFLRVAEELFRALPGVKIFIVGGTDSPRYVRRLRPRVSREALGVLCGSCGTVSWSSELPVLVLGQRADAAELVAAFDVVLLPSLYEGLPYSLLEAMAQGVAVVASRVTGNQDVIEHGVSGFLVPTRDVTGFVRISLEVVADASLRARIGAAARRRVAAEFTEERFLERMAALYGEFGAR